MNKSYSFGEFQLRWRNRRYQARGRESHGDKLFMGTDSVLVVGGMVVFYRARYWLNDGWGWIRMNVWQITRVV